MPGEYLFSIPVAELRHEMYVVQRQHPQPQQFVLPHKMGQIRPAVTRARLAEAFRVQRAELPPVTGVFEVDPAFRGKDRAVACQPR